MLVVIVPADTIGVPSGSPATMVQKDHVPTGI
jgi:hypothetical protein